eukprot:SAG31_NODE_26953_length_433_cov_1.553892_1_plen_54_part_01
MILSGARARSGWISHHRIASMRSCMLGWLLIILEFIYNSAYALYYIVIFERLYI